MFELPEGLEAQERPDRISKLAFYLIDKEPLIYLFIINSDFIPDPEGKMIGPFKAGVYFHKNRVLFFYKPDELESMPREELYFVIIHEAFHIFKKHIERHEGLKDAVLRNIAEDAVINYEIGKATYEGVITPKAPEGVVEVPNDFTRKFYYLNDDAIETHRIYHWLKKKKEEARNNSFKVGDIVKINDEEDQFGRITGKVYGERGTYRVKRESKEDIISGKSDDDAKESEEHGSNLTPVVTSNDIKNGNIPNGEFEGAYGFDYHIENGKNAKEAEEEMVEKNFFTDKIVSQAEKMTDQIKQSGKSAGTGVGSLISRLKKMNKPKINWKKEFGRKMNVFMSKNSFLHQPVDSYINYPWNPTSRYGILGKHPIMQRKNLQTYVIFAIDTSGLVFSSREELEKFFTEVDAASKQLEFTRKGHVLTLQWDYNIQDDMKIYKTGDWKKFDVKGGGGTSPRCVFEYLNKVFVEKNGRYVVNTDNVKFATEDKKKLPFLVILTDGFFYDSLDDKALGIYAENKDNILYFTKSTRQIYPPNYIEYV